MMKEICFILPDLSAGGAERVVSILSAELIKKGRKVSILIYNKKIEYNIDPSVDIFVIQANGRKFKRICSSVKQIRAICRRKNNNVILIPMLDSSLRHALTAAFGTGVPVVSCERSDPRTKCKNAQSMMVKRLLFMMSDYCVVQTDTIKSFFPSEVHKKCSIILNPVNIPKRAWRCNPGNHKIVSIGRLVGAKNYPMALEAFKLVHDNFPDATYDIYGTGDLRQLLEAESKRLGIEDVVSFRGVTSDVYAVLEKAAVFISTSDYEGLQNSMLEAMSIGIPVVCTDCDGGGARMIIEDGKNGLIIPKREVQALYEKIKYLFENEAIAAELGRNARERCMELTPQRICDEWIKVFDRLED